MGVEKANEISSLDQIAKNSLYTTESNSKMIKYCFSVFERFLVPGSILEMGPAEGLMTQFLIQASNDVTLLEGSMVFCKMLKEKYPKVDVVNSLFEDYKPAKKFDNIILGHVLEHVEDPERILSLCKNWLTERGKVLAAVPNARSIHRQAAVVMGLIPSEDTMSELDYHHGHRRIFNPETFRNVFTRSGLRVDYFGGYWLKPVTNAQIHQHWNESMLDAFMKLGERYPDIAGEIFVVASR